MRAEVTTPWCFFVFGYFITEMVCFHVELRAPRYVHIGGHVILKCDYNVPSDQLHKVEWFMGGRKIFQFVKGRNPPFRNYTTPGATLDWKHSNDKQLTLKDLDFDASGVYSCEVSTNTPIYTKPSDDQEVTVMQMQLEDPFISFGKPVYTVGEWLQVNCTSGPARPTPDVTWLINGRQAEESRMKTFPDLRPNCITVQLTIPVIQEYVDGLELTCLATIPAYLGHHTRHSQYADHRAHSITVEVVPNVPEPEPASKSLSSQPCLLLLFFVTLHSLVASSKCL